WLVSLRPSNPEISKRPHTTLLETLFTACLKGVGYHEICFPVDRDVCVCGSNPGSAGDHVQFIFVESARLTHRTKLVSRRSETLSARTNQNAKPGEFTPIT